MVPLVGEVEIAFFQQEGQHMAPAIPSFPFLMLFTYTWFQKNSTSLRIPRKIWRTVSLPLSTAQHLLTPSQPWSTPGVIFLEDVDTLA